MKVNGEVDINNGLVYKHQTNLKTLLLCTYYYTSAWFLLDLKPSDCRKAMKFIVPLGRNATRVQNVTQFILIFISLLIS